MLTHLSTTSIHSHLYKLSFSVYVTDATILVYDLIKKLVILKNSRIQIIMKSYAELPQSKTNHFSEY